METVAPHCISTCIPADAKELRAIGNCHFGEGNNLLRTEANGLALKGSLSPSISLTTAFKVTSSLVQALDSRL